MDVTPLLDAVLAIEGGYSNHSADRGGATRWGITEKTARSFGYHGDMRALPQRLAREIYRARYWESPGFDAVADHSETIAAELFDTAVNMGPGTAIRFLQRALNALNRNERDFADIVIDGKIGPQTLAALKAFQARRPRGDTVLLKALEALQGAHYISLAEQRPANEAFLYGWLANRLAS